MRMYRPLAVYRSLASIVAVTALVLTATAPGHADPPGDAAPNPYPSDDLIYAAYNRAEPSQFFIPGIYGVFFLSPTGLTCGIWIRGSFGCGGSIPGAPPGASRIGWFNGDKTVHYDLSAAIQFPNVQAVQVLQPGSYVSWNETTCVTTVDSSTYCKRGSFRFFITDHGTWLSPWYATQRW
jgi:hypothetical protein